MELNVNDTVQSINELSTKASDMAHKWSKRNASPDSFKGYVASHKNFLGKMSTVMSVVSVGFSAADAFGVFGPGKDAEVKQTLIEIEDQIKTLQTKMLEQFNNLSSQINYVSANFVVASAINDINTAKKTYDRYIKHLRENRDEFTIESSKIEFEKTDLSKIRTAIDKLYSSFFTTDKSGNILSAIYDYYKGSPEVLVSRGSDIIFKIQDGIQVIAMFKRLEREKLWKEKYPNNPFNISEALFEINTAISEDYFSDKQDIRLMNEQLKDYLEDALNKLDSNLPAYFSAYLLPLLSNSGTTPTLICTELEKLYPVVDIMTVKYSDCTGTDKHLLDYRTSKAITKFREGRKNWVIFWDWRKELTDAQKTSLQHRASSDWSSKIETFGNMPTSHWTQKVRSTDQTTYQIPEIIKLDTPYNSLSDATPGVNAVLIKIEASSVVDWAHTGSATGRAFLKKGKNYWVAWFLLDIP